ncbi:viral A-type inclusion repeat-containing protein [Clostridium botulinum B str. Osaka05]|uniref:Viral A-type inclusion repeat-containing protein n=1 Tax=Clostridium botulinum B str. Osaka05 TaxID=1407017 RepID=A0A0S6U4C4_CLOBO|nr:viral A-type inclusion repeat-containing protein [Clostridium botulinum B str. Osaka05]
MFISGYIRSYIEYITLDQINENSITTKNQGIISHKDFSKAININLLFFNNMKEGEAFFVDFNNYIKDKKILLGKIEKLDIKSSNIYKDVENSPFQREKCYLTLQQNLLIRAKINVLQNNVVIL